MDSTLPNYHSHAATRALLAAIQLGDARAASRALGQGASPYGFWLGANSSPRYLLSAVAHADHPIALASALMDRLFARGPHQPARALTRAACEAVHHGADLSLAYLIAKGARISDLSIIADHAQTGYAPLEQSIARPDMVRMLLSAGADASFQDEPSGRSALMACMLAAHRLGDEYPLRSAALLIAAGARLDATDCGGRPAMAYAEQSTNPVAIEMMRTALEREALDQCSHHPTAIAPMARL